MIAGDSDLTARFAHAMDHLAPDRPTRLGIAVSGGGDSTALMHLAHQWCGAELHVATVNHGLRPEAGHEAEFVAQAAQALGLKHTTLHWQSWEKRGNLQDAARNARRHLLTAWAQRERLQCVLLGHTQDDQAETFLMRLARGSGVDGLAAMVPAQTADGLHWLRPLLNFSRSELRDWLRASQITWVDDPSNDDTGFDRIKARQALDTLASMGLTRARLSETAARMTDARAVLDAAAANAAHDICRFEHGDFVFDTARLDALPQDTRYRLVARAVCEISSNAYRPRLSALRKAMTTASATVHGCLITRGARDLRITREANAVRDLRTPLCEWWDGRWQVLRPDDQHAAPHLCIGPLGEAGLQHCNDRTGWRLPRASLLASPAVWDGTRLIAAPLAGFAPEWRICVREPPESLPRGPYSH